MSLSITSAASLSSPPRMLVTVTATGSSGTTDVVDVFRVHADGERFRLITSDRPYISGGSWAGYDYHAPFNQAFHYRVESGGEAAESASTSQVSHYVWLLHPEDNAKSVLVDRSAVHLGEMGDPAYDSRATLVDILDSKRPVSLGDWRRAGEKRDLSIVCMTEAALAKVEGLLADDGPILISTPYGPSDIGWRWVQPAGYTPDNPAGRRINHRRVVKFAYVECSQPDIDALAEWTSDDLAATGWTSDVAVTKYVTAQDMALDRRVA